MTGRVLLAGIALATLGAAAALPAAQSGKTVPAQRDWTRVVVATPEGGYRMGNPQAPVKLIEYGSLTCSHCATFAKKGMQSLAGTYVRRGKVSYEYRNFVLNGLDVAATLVARCGGPTRFFPVADKLYANQDQWTGRIENLTTAQKQALNALPENQRLGRLAQLAGIPGIAAQQGIPPASAQRCLADRAAFERLGKLNEAAAAQGVQGTPTFFINGANIGAHSWETLEPILREASG